MLNSFVSACAALEIDAQAIAGFNGPGPFKISNNYLGGDTENILFGGADPRISNLIPSDIEITRNVFTKPSAGGIPSFPNRQLLVSPPFRVAERFLRAPTISPVVAVLNTEIDQAVSAESAESAVLVRSDGSSVSLSWNPVAGADFYRVYRGTGSGGQNRYMETADSRDVSRVYRRGRKRGNAADRGQTVERQEPSGAEECAAGVDRRQHLRAFLGGIAEGICDSADASQSGRHGGLVALSGTSRSATTSSVMSPAPSISSARITSNPVSTRLESPSATISCTTLATRGAASTSC